MNLKIQSWESWDLIQLLIYMIDGGTYLERLSEFSGIVL